MDHQSIEQMTRHIKDVPRIEARFATLSPEEIDRLVDERQTTASIRWAQCRRSFQMLFMTMSRGNRMPIDSFEIRLATEQIGGNAIDTCVRVWRDRPSNTFNVKPFTRNGRIEDHEFVTESFGDIFRYRHGTYLSKSATLEVDHDDPDSTIRLTRIEGKLVGVPLTAKEKAVFLGALDNFILPSLENTQGTLMLLSQAAMDESLNPDIAKKFRVDH